MFKPNENEHKLSIIFQVWRRIKSWWTRRFYRLADRRNRQGTHSFSLLLTPPHSFSLFLTSPHFTPLLITPPHFSTLISPPHSSSPLLTPPHSSSLLLTPLHSSTLLLTPPHSSSPPLSLLSLPSPPQSGAQIGKLTKIRQAETREGWTKSKQFFKALLWK